MLRPGQPPGRREHKWAENRFNPSLRPLHIYRRTAIPPGFPALLRFEQRPLRRLSRQILERIGKMVPVVKEIHTPGPLLEQKSEEG